MSLSSQLPVYTQCSRCVLVLEGNEIQLLSGEMCVETCRLVTRQVLIVNRLVYAAGVGAVDYSCMWSAFLFCKHVDLCTHNCTICKFFRSEI